MENKYDKIKGKDNLILWVLGSICIFLLTNCGIKKELNYGDYHVTKNKIVFDKSNQKVEDRATIYYGLQTLYQQKKKTKIGLWAYYKTNEPTDTSGFQNFLRKRVAEKPSLFDENAMISTANSMENYLEKKGYSQAKVIPKEILLPKKKKAEVTYTIKLGKQYLIDTIEYISIDTTIADRIERLEASSLLRRGDPIDAAVYNQEVLRITDSLRNDGYAYFFANYIEHLKADSISSPNGVNLSMRIRPSLDDEVHTQYRIGKVEIYPQYQPTDNYNQAKRQFIDGYEIITMHGQSGINTDVLLDNIFIKEGELYRQDNFTKTNIQLSNLEIYRFVNIRFTKDLVKEKVLNVKISLTPRYKQQYSVDLDLNRSEFISRFWGINSRFSWINRNTFNGAQQLSLSLQAGVEFNFRNIRQTPNNSFNIFPRIDYTLPAFKDFTRSFYVLSKIKFGKDKYLLSPTFYQTLKDNARYHVSLSYNLQRFFQLFQDQTLNFSMGNNLRINSNTRIQIDQIGMDVYNSKTEPLFDTLLMSNPTQERSFNEPQLFTGLLFKRLDYFYNSPENFRRESYRFRFNVEQSGGAVLLLNKIINNGETPFTLGGGKFSHYLRSEFELSYKRRLDDKQSLAFRFLVGAATPIGKLTTSVPFVKQFAAGGQFSMRGWELWELGPGSYYDPDVVDPPFFQTGDMQIELNAEYRFDILKSFYLKGALFLDAGNIWALREDLDRPGAKISSTFLNEFAIAGGYGIRFDLEYFLIRVDMGYKLRTPYQVNNEYWQFQQFRTWNFWDYFRNANLNLALGVPF